MRDLNLPARFWSKVDRRSGPAACWPWLAATTGKSGYPVFSNKVDRSVRRYLWFLLHGELSKQFTYSCQFETVNCVNPTHIVQRSRGEYVRLGVERGTHRSPFIAATPNKRRAYAAKAKVVVDTRRSRHVVTPEERLRGHRTRGCTVGGAPRRTSYDMPLRQRRQMLLDPCVYCGGVATEVDHIQPFARGGSHDWSNRASACRPCNRAKGDKPLLRFLVGRGVR